MHSFAQQNVRRKISATEAYKQIHTFNVGYSIALISLIVFVLWNFICHRVNFTLFQNPDQIILKLRQILVRIKFCLFWPLILLQNVQRARTQHNCQNYFWYSYYPVSLLYFSLYSQLIRCKWCASVYIVYARMIDVCGCVQCLLAAVALVLLSRRCNSIWMHRYVMDTTVLCKMTSLPLSNRLDRLNRLNRVIYASEGEPNKWRGMQFRLRSFEFKFGIKVLFESDGTININDIVWLQGLYSLTIIEGWFSLDMELVCV